MRKIREILRLHYELKLGKKQIARVCSMSSSTVVDYVRRAKAAGIEWPLAVEVDDSALEALLFPPVAPAKASTRPMPPMEDIHKELRKKGVTLLLLWFEYKENYPDGYQYSQFCELIRRWEKTLDLSLRQQYRAGEKMFVDFTGQTIPIYDSFTGKTTKAEIFVAVLGASNYTIVSRIFRTFDLATPSGFPLRCQFLC